MKCLLHIDDSIVLEIGTDRRRESTVGDARTRRPLEGSVAATEVAFFVLSRDSRNSKTHLIPDDSHVVAVIVGVVTIAVVIMDLVVV